MEVKTDPFKEGARIKGGPTVQGFWQMRSGRLNPGRQSNAKPNPFLSTGTFQSGVGRADIGLHIIVWKIKSVSGNN